MAMKVRMAHDAGPRRIRATLNLRSGLLVVESEQAPESRPTTVETTGITLADEPAPASRPGLARCARVVSIAAARRAS